MTQLTVELVSTSKLDIQIRNEVINVFKQSFDVAIDANSCLERYFANIKSLCLAWDETRLVGFQFYQCVEILGRTVHHFSLAGRLPDKRYGGLQAKFGSMLIRKAITEDFPWNSVYLAGVTNSPKSYANMYAIGGKCYPNVINPEVENPFDNWYYDVADQLRLAPVDQKGLLKDRMKSLGFSLQADSFGTHPIGQAYDCYVEHQRNHGIFVLIEIIPLRDIPLYLYKMFSRSLKRLMYRKKR